MPTLWRNMLPLYSGSVCVCVCVWVCVCGMCVCVVSVWCVYQYTYVCIYNGVFMYYVCIYVCIYYYVYICVYIHMYVCIMYVPTYLYMYLCIIYMLAVSKFQPITYIHYGAVQNHLSHFTHHNNTTRPTNPTTVSAQPKVTIPLDRHQHTQTQPQLHARTHTHTHAPTQQPMCSPALRWTNLWMFMCLWVFLLLPFLSVRNAPITTPCPTLPPLLPPLAPPIRVLNTIPLLQAPACLCFHRYSRRNTRSEFLHTQIHTLSFNTADYRDSSFNTADYRDSSFNTADCREPENILAMHGPMNVKQAPLSCALCEGHMFRPSVVLAIAQWRTGGGGRGFNPPPRNSEDPPKWCQTQPDCEKLLKIAEFRTPTPQDVRIKGSKILKLPPVRNCFTLAMTNKLVVIINSLKVPKIKKILLYEMKFVIPNYSCLQNSWLGGLPPPDPRSVCPLSSTEFVEPPRTKFLGTPLGVRDILWLFLYIILRYFPSLKPKMGIA